LRGNRRAPFYDVSVSASSQASVLRKLEQVLTVSDLPDQYRVVRDFEREFAKRFGGGYARGLNSGSTALYFALKALGVGPGKEVITVANTFVSTVSAVVQTGATCRFADIDPVTGLMPPEALGALINERTAAIVPVHMYGAMADMARICAHAESAGIPVIEDACQAIGATQAGRAAGTWGSVGCFSFHATKLVGAPADGGLALTQTEALHEAISAMAEPSWENALLDGQERMPSRLSALSVPVLRARLTELDGVIERRAAQYARYRTGLASHAHLGLHAPVPGTRSSFRNVIITSPRSAVVADALKKRRLPTRKIYPQSLTLIDHIELSGQSLPNTRRLLQQHLAVPVGHQFSDAQIDEVIETVLEVHRADRFERSERQGAS